jgi:hypothetical protein
MFNRLYLRSNRIYISSLCALLLNSISANCALADDPTANKGTASAPVAFVSAVSGVIFGTPIAIARMTGRSMSSIYHMYDKDPVCWQFWGRPVALPLGLVEGTVKGCIIGPKNAFRYAQDKPFSKDTFSLDDLD